MIERLQVNYKEKLVATRDSLIDHINKTQGNLDKQMATAKSELHKMIEDSHEVQNRQLEALRKDTETQLHGICSMIEEVGKMIKETEDRVNLNFPKLDSKI